MLSRCLEYVVPQAEIFRVQVIITPGKVVVVALCVQGPGLVQYQRRSEDAIRRITDISLGRESSFDIASLSATGTRWPAKKARWAAPGIVAG